MGDVGEPDFADDEEIYEIDKVHHAERVGRDYKVYILWKNKQISWRWYSDLRKETKNDELLQEMTAAVEHEKSRHMITNPAEAAECETEDGFVEPPPDDSEVQVGAANPAPLGRGKRVRQAATRHNVTQFMVDIADRLAACAFFA